ncbi:hypothetical protein SAMN06297144_1541 [Sphingomonas guangdongensis]|uniref:Uncharacterized protein n=1 Tax=Sphingomonas guangdongensis TaxID=1141890 RepID=A0A285QX84_9SPHN|nr:hypothetical protein [Sphingomonas guangdongensis]SOB86436.1 hypothetical protein SAMN06297144_1541 [Sphingomonas guangdongensis]
MTTTAAASDTPASPRSPQTGGPALLTRAVAALPREGAAKPAASGEATARAFRALLGSKDEPTAPADRSDDQPRGALIGAATSLPLTIAAAAPVSESGALQLDPAAAEAVGKLANAVAAALAQGREPVITIQFNDPAALSQGAVLIREVSGALTVRLEGVAAAALALPPRALEDQLRVALDRRRVRLGRLEWGAAADAVSSTAGRSESR